jgi:hypothetical protein
MPYLYILRHYICSRYLFDISSIPLPYLFHTSSIPLLYLFYTSSIPLPYLSLVGDSDSSDGAAPRPKLNQVSESCETDE